MSEGLPPPSYDDAAKGAPPPEGQGQPTYAPPTQGQGQPTYAPPPQQQDDGRWVLSYVDFTPGMLSAPGVFSLGSYEPFSVLIPRANQWLQQNQGMKVRSCESVECKATQQGADTVSSVYYESGKMASVFIRSLRLWVVPKGPGDNPAPQQLGYLNVVPACTGTGGIFSQPTFENYGQTVEKLNQMFQQQPLPGRIMNIETLDVKFQSWTGSVNPDESMWMESGKHATCFLNIIRVFYEGGPTCNEQIGSIDFVPARTVASGFASMGAFEPLSQLLGKANQWMQQNPALPVCNIQTLDYKLDSHWGGESLNTQRTFYFESGKYSTFYVRIIRVYYATGMFGRTGLQTLSYKTFVPSQLTMGGMFSAPQFESLAQSMQRAMAWLKLTNAKVVACETQAVKLQMMGAESPAGSTERTYYYNSGRHAEYFLLVFRVFLDGFYQEPPAELLPPLPQIAQSADTGCCNIL